MFTLPEPLGIDPRVELVFAWLFGDPAHEPFRLDFLNAVLAGDAPRILRATVTNPVHPGQQQGDRELRVDVEVTDESGRTYQIEMQRQVRPGLEKRMLYGWARLYASQTRERASYRLLRPVVAIWLCEGTPFPRSERAHLSFRALEMAEHTALHPDLRIDVIQLARVATSGAGLPDDAELGRWCRFLNEVAGWRSLPAEVYTPTLENAMRAIDTFRTDAEMKALYQARLNFQLEFAGELDAERAEKVEALAKLEAALEEKEAALAAKEAERAAKEAERTEKEAERAAKEAERAEKEAERAAKEAALAELALLRAQLKVPNGGH